MRAGPLPSHEREHCWVIRRTPKKSVSKSCFASSIVVSSSELISVVPALLTSASIRQARSGYEWTSGFVALAMSGGAWILTARD